MRPHGDGGEVNPDFTSAAELGEIPCGGVASEPYIVDGCIIVADTTEDFARSNFIELNAAEGVRRLGSAIGQVLEVFRVL